MKVWSDSFEDGGWIPEANALGKRDASNRAELSANRNPHLAWSDLPDGTKSLAIVMYDVSVPSKPDDVNQEGRVVSPDLPRVEFDHWALINVSPDAPIEAGTHSDGVTPGGKTPAHAPEGTSHGVNDYTGWFAGDEGMRGDYYGYDGPGPPWNDGLVHEYVLTVYALDTEDVGVEGAYKRADVMRAIEGHVLGQASLRGKYTINPDAVER